MTDYILDRLFRSFSLIAQMLAAFALVACSAPNGAVEFHDPYEPVNRVTHGFNKGVDRVFFRPASQVYGTLLPNPVRQGLSNAAENLDAPRSMLNHALQGEGEDAIHNGFRFLLNTTLGVFGIFDPATSFGLEERETGFADTLAIWGVREGAYQELPVFGPSTERDTAGFIVDIVTNPIGAVLPDDSEEIAGFTSLPSVLNSRYAFSETFDSILYESADSYVQMRLYYLESRRFELGGQSGATDAFDPYEDLYDGLYEEIRFRSE